MAVIVLVSFPLTYYMPVITASRQFHTLHHIHGIAFFAWIGLYVVQTQLAASRKISRHREIGLVGFLLSGALIPLGIWMAQRAAEIRLTDGFSRPYEFTWYNVSDIGLFTVFMLGAILLVTRHTDWHRRLIYVAALCLMAPAATRWTMKLPYLDPLVLDIAVYTIVYPFLIALALYDRRSLGKFHTATVISFVTLGTVHISNAYIARTDWWNDIAPSLIGPP